MNTMNARSFCTMILCLAGLASTTQADAFVEPDDRGMAITSAIRNIDEGQTIWLSAGEHIESISYHNCKDITIRGQGYRRGDTVIRTDRLYHTFRSSYGCRENENMPTITFRDLTFASSANGNRFKDCLDINQIKARFINCDFIEIQSHYTNDPEQPSGSRTTGAIDCYEGELEFHSCRFIDCGVSWERPRAVLQVLNGGAIYAFDSLVEIHDSRFEGNYLTVMADDRLAGAQSMANGGAVSMRRGELVVSGCEFVENSVSGLPGATQPDLLRGGAIYAEYMDRIRVNDSEFIRNSAMSAGNRAQDGIGTGGAIHAGGTLQNNGGYFDWAMYTSDNLFLENEAGSDGGAIQAQAYAIAKIRRDRFECNSLDQVAGEWSDFGGVEFIDCPDCPADLNGDGLVDKRDLLLIFYNLGPVKKGQKGDSATCDLTGDGVVNVKDYFAWFRLADC